MGRCYMFHFRTPGRDPKKDECLRPRNTAARRNGVHVALGWNHGRCTIPYCSEKNKRAPVCTQSCVGSGKFSRSANGVCVAAECGINCTGSSHSTFAGHVICASTRGTVRDPRPGLLCPWCSCNFFDLTYGAQSRAKQIPVEEPPSIPER